MTKKSLALLVLISLFYLVSRLYKLTVLPASVYWDEASIGYNAFAILKDLRDEWGEFLPLHFRAFGEFKLPVYIYSVAFADLILKNLTLALRLPAVLYGLGSVLLTYLISKKITNYEKIALLSAFLLLVFPGYFLITRVGYEATAGLFFYMLMIYFMLQKKSLFILFSAISMIIAVYSYNSFRFIAPLTFAILVFDKLKSTKFDKKLILISFLSFIIIVISFLPVYRLYAYDFGGARLNQVAVEGDSFEKLIQITKNISSHFSYDFLFDIGDVNPRSNIPGYGILFVFTIPFLVLGFIYSIQKKNRYLKLFGLFLLLTVIPASITRESPHMLRSIGMLPFLAIYSGCGIYILTEFFNKKYMTFLIIVVYIFLFSAFYNFFLNNYWTNYSKDWQFGYFEIFNNYQNDLKQNKQVFISDYYGQPYIFALFYQKIDPLVFRESVERNAINNWGSSVVSGFDKYQFGKAYDLEKLKDGIVFATDMDKLESEPLSRIQFLNGSTAFWVYKL